MVFSSEKSAYLEQNSTIHDIGDYPLGLARAQVHQTYIVAQTADSIVIVDQHAAHERILYENAIDALENKGLHSQSILFPQTIEFDKEEFTYFNNILPYIMKIGFKIRTFGDNTIIVEGVPPELPHGKEKDIIKDVLEHSI